MIDKLHKEIKRTEKEKREIVENFLKKIMEEEPLEEEGGGDGGGAPAGDGGSTGHGGGGSYGSPDSITYDGNDSQFWAGKVAGERNKKNRSGWQNLGGNKHKVYEELVSEMVNKMGESVDELWLNRIYEQIKEQEKPDVSNWREQPPTGAADKGDMSHEYSQQGMAQRLYDIIKSVNINPKAKSQIHNWEEIADVLREAHFLLKGAKDKYDLMEAGLEIYKLKAALSQNQDLMTAIKPVFAWIQDTTRDGVQTKDPHPNSVGGYEHKPSKEYTKHHSYEKGKGEWPDPNDEKERNKRPESDLNYPQDYAGDPEKFGLKKKDFTRDLVKEGEDEFKIFHSDHGIKSSQLEYIKNVLRQKAPQGFFIQEIKIPTELGTVPSGLYGPASGDDPIPEDKVFYSNRGSDRAWEDRMIKAPMRPVDFVQAIGIRDGESFTVFTIYGGPLAPQNPQDPSNQDPEASQKFWSQHALATGSDDVSESIYDNEEERLKHVMGKVADAEARRGEFDPDKEIDYERKVRTMLGLQKLNKDQERWGKDLKSKMQTQVGNKPIKP